MLDIIGDIHGHADELIKLLHALEYENTDGSYRHASRKAVFVGDFIDRGPKIRETLQIVRPMVESGAALAVLGNHEFNAISYHTQLPGKANRFARKHNEKNRRQHQETIDQLQGELAEYIEWFRTLPVSIEMHGIRVVHATWDQRHLQIIAESILRFGGVNSDFIIEANNSCTNLHAAVDVVLKGKEMKLPEGLSFRDKDGHERTHLRVKWFESPEGHTYSSYALSSEEGFPDKPITDYDAGSVAPYPSNEIPVFFGHYWLQANRPRCLASNVACVDYSVAKGGQLAAYRWNGESKLLDENFISVASGS